jgi:hypothetical protein
MNKFGEPPQLTTIQKIQLHLTGKVYLCHIQTATDLASAPVYIVYCSKHGNYLDSPHGWDGHFCCDKCLKEQKQKCRVLDTVTI